MARSRNIKPALFSNDTLAELDPLDRLAFIGLWTIVNYKGCAEYRPKRIKAQILPYDNCDMSKIMTNLNRLDFLRIYTVDGQDYFKVLNFEKHQNPHKNERDSGTDIPDLPDPKGLEEDSSLIAINPDNNGTTRADSLLLIPDPLLLKPSKSTRFAPPKPNEVYDYFLTKGLSIEESQSEGSKFINHYESNGWLVGKNKMKNWKAAANGWTTRMKSYEADKKHKPAIDLNDTGWSKPDPKRAF